jgi:1-phosphatidylinositol-4-phosphate 5-kinase
MRCCSKKTSHKPLQSAEVFKLSQKFRFSPQELAQYQARFNRISKGHSITLDKFRISMGLLGLHSARILADRIFAAMDQHNKGFVEFEDFLEYMDILMHGTRNEKIAQSFKLIAQHQSVISLQDFENWVKSVWKMLNEINGQTVEENSERIFQMFQSIDDKSDGVIDIDEYRQNAFKQSSLMSWFNLCNIGEEEIDDLIDPELVGYRKRLESIENNLHLCITALRKKESHKEELSPIIEVENFSSVDIGRGPVLSEPVVFEPNGDLDSPQFSDYYEQAPASFSECDVLEKLTQLSVKISNLKSESAQKRSATLYNVPKKTENKKKSKVSWGDEDWNLILYMMLGIQKAVNSVREDLQEVIDLSFKSISQFELSVESNNQISKSTAKFIDFSPIIFKKLRHLFDINDKTYLQSLGMETIMSSLLRGEFSSLTGLISSGKSGSFFYFSDDSRYVLKTMSSDEFSFLSSLLPDYYAYITENPDSFIQKFFGFHSIKYLSDSQQLRKNFIVMENIFSTGHEIHLRYDLKGSTVGRETDPNEDFSIARKDLDFNRSGLKVRLRFEEKERIISQIRKDCEFFEQMGIIDYSLLLGIHYFNGDERVEKDVQHAFLSSDGKCLYFIGIIDVLTEYNMKKRLENWVKSPFLGKEISCVPPKQYSRRFFRYIHSIFE